MASLYDTKNKAGEVVGYTVTWMEGEDRKYKRLPRDKEAAKEFKREKERLETRHRLGLIDPKERKLQEAAALDIDAHIDVFVKYLASKGNKEASIETARTNCEKIFKLAKVRKLPDIDVDEITEALAGLRGPHRGGSNGSYNQRRNSVRNFTAWCVRTSRLASDPLLDLPGLNEEEDRRRPKRTLTLDDLARLIRSAHQGPKVNLQSGPTRSLIYRLTVVTGMRYNEVKRMRVRDLRLDADPPKVEVDAPHEKRGRDTRFTLTRAIAEELRVYVAAMRPADIIFPRMPRIGTVLIYRDMERCDPPIPVADHKGRVFDFHGLRAMHAIALDMAGAPLAVIVKSMRHSNPKITNRYLNAADSDVDRTIERLASFTPLRPIEDHSGRFDAASGAASVTPVLVNTSPQLPVGEADTVDLPAPFPPAESCSTISTTTARRRRRSPRPRAADHPRECRSIFHRIIMRCFAMRKNVWMLGLAMAAAGFARGDEPADSPRPIPLTRPEMKQLLEEMKARTPRIPLPKLTAEEKEKLGERGGGYEGRLRSLYMPSEGARNGAGGRGGQGGGPGGALAGFGFGRTNDPNMSLDYRFKTELFWIVSRANNCQYCLGHQEIKLAVAGMKEDELAALDGDWSGASPDRRAAYAFARKLTYEPHQLGDADIDRLREHFKDLQILEMILSVSGNNAINRWKEGVGVPQSQDLSGFASRSETPPPTGAVLPDKTFLTPTSDAFKDKVSKVAALSVDEATGKPAGLAVCKRPALESREEVEEALAACKARKARLPLVAEGEARGIVSEAWPQEGPLPNWVRLLANFPREGVARIGAVRTAEEKGDLSPLLKAQVGWIIARQDRAWYALGQAKRKLEALGQTAEQVAALDGDWSGFAPADRALFNVARKLAASPVVLTDADVEAALKLAGPRDVVQLISYTTNRASFDRITEAAGLPLEE